MFEVLRAITSATLQEIDANILVEDKATRALRYLMPLVTTAVRFGT